MKKYETKKQAKDQKKDNRIRGKKVFLKLIFFPFTFPSPSSHI